MHALAPSHRPVFDVCPLCLAREHRPIAVFPELHFVSCSACALVYKRSQVEGLEKAYERGYFAEGRARYMRRWEHRVSKCRRQLLAALEYAPGARDVLDVGCSVGYVLEAARRLGLAPVGLDVSRFAVETCRERGYEAEVGDLVRLPFPDCAFDIVTAKHTLEHTEQPLVALQELRRVLRPGGVLFLVVPDAGYWKRHLLTRSGSYFRPDRLGWQHHVYYAEPHLARMCEAAGLTPVKAGKAVFRRRLARGTGRLWEALRFGGLWAWVQSARALHLRRELQLIARREG